MRDPGGFGAALTRAWWTPRPTALAVALLPLAALFAAVAGLRTLGYRCGLRRPVRLPVPVIVVGNLIVGGAGKTPTVIALVQWLQASGWHPGVVSRGFGRSEEAPREVTRDDSAREVGDEPLLIRRRTGVPLFVGRRRAVAGAQLLRSHPEVDVLVSDDGLQHHALGRDVEVIVFDRRGAGNGWLLPAGPLREPLAAARRRPAPIVLYNAASPSTPLPGFTARRALAGATELAAWRSGAAPSREALLALRGQAVLAAAGIAEPERFFAMLEAEGLTITRLPLPDHAPLDPPPWGDAPSIVIVTEKDAVKLRADAAAGPRIWVVGLDFTPPPPFFEALHTALSAARPAPTRPPWTTA